MIIKKASTVFLGTWLLVPINLLTSVIVVNELGASGKGYAVLFISLVNTLGVILLIGLPPAIIYFVQKKIFSLDKIYTSFLLFSILAFIFCIIVTNLFGLDQFLGLNFNFFEKIIFCSCVFFFIYTSNLSSLILALGNSKNYTALIVLRSIIFLFLIFIFLKILDRDLSSYFVAYFLSEMFFFITVTLSLKFIIGVNLTKFKLLNYEEIKQIFKYSLKNYPNPLISLYQNSLINYLILFLINVEAVGIFSIAISFHNLLNSIPRSVNTLLLGQTAKLKLSLSKMVIRQTLRFLNSILIIFVIMGVVFVGYAINFLYGAEFVDAIIPAQIMIICGLLTSNISTFQSYLFATNNPFEVSKINFCTMIISIIFVFFLSKIFFINGVALSFFISKTLILIYMMLLLKKKNVYKNIFDLIFLTKRDLKNFKKKL